MSLARAAAGRCVRGPEDGTDEQDALARLSRLLAEAHHVEWDKMPAVVQAAYMAKVRDILLEAGWMFPSVRA